jgi:hypothetical protein
LAEALGFYRTFVVYLWGMKNNAAQAHGKTEKLIRVRAERRGEATELRVHYEKASVNGCDTYTIFSVEDANFVPVPIDSLR